MGTVWYVVVALSCLHICESAIKLPKDVKVPAILVFGDSVVDPGNNNYLKTIGRANFPPYGRDFDGGVPTGRYSNGKIPSDLLGNRNIHTFLLLPSVFRPFGIIDCHMYIWHIQSQVISKVFGSRY